MILQALKEYYDRKPDLPRYGFEMKEIPFVVTLDAQGNPRNLESTYEGDGRERRAKLRLVPKAEKKAFGVKSNLLWENPEYALGAAKATGREKNRVAAQHEAFKKRMSDLGDVGDDGLRAVRQFLAKSDKVESLKKYPAWNQLLEEGAVLSFQLLGDPYLVAERPAVKAAIVAALGLTDDARGTCLITGEESVIERLHPVSKRVLGAQTSGANIVAVNNKIQNGNNVGQTPAFSSFRKQQGYNSPVGKEAAFSYTTALNHLLGRDSTQRIQVGDASTVFWSQRANSLEHQVASLFDEPPKDDPDRGVRAVESLFRSIRTGAFSPEDEKPRFYVLGLAPNASRIAIRFWIVDTVKGMSQTIGKHFSDTEIVVPERSNEDWPQWLPLNALLAATANVTNYDSKKPNLVRFRERHYDVRPNLEGDMMRSILEGLPYPQTLLQAAIRRIRAEHDITYPRAALIKACLNRSARFNDPQIKEELHVCLDLNNVNVGYRLGRLFAALERIQIRKFTQKGGKAPNSTIRDKYYGSASGTPVAVFGTLIRLSNHHLANLDNVGERINFENLLGEIMCGIKDFPSYLRLDDQGRFAIGYYHQMQDFFTKKNDDQRPKGDRP
jgi:CRISPR-associated protein Csd1